MKTRRRGIGSNVKATKLAAGAEPVWNVIMPAGEWHRGDWGVVKCDRSFFASCVANWKKVGSPELPVDRFHWGSSNETAVTDPRAKAAVGWIQDLRVTSGGDLEALIAWNEDGKADIEAKRFQYFSPEWHEDAVDPSTGKRQGPTLFGGSLLNDPYFKTLPPLAASDAPSKENVMTREELIAMFGLPADATDADIKAATKKAADAGAEAKRIAAAAEEKRKASETRTGELEAELKKAREATEAADKRIAKIEADAKKAAEDAAIEKLTAKLEREGRITANQKEHVADDVRTYGLEKATKRWEAASVVVPLGELGRGSRPDPTLDDAEKTFKASVAEFEKTMPSSEAYRAAARKHPDLYQRLNTNQTSRAN